MLQAFWLQFFAGGSLLLTTPTVLVYAQPRYKGITYPLNGGTYDIEFVYNFTKYLHSIYHYHSFLLYARPTSRFRPNFMILRDFEQALIEDFNVPIIVWASGHEARFQQNIGLSNLAFVQFEDLKDPILTSVDKTLEGLHLMTILFYFRNKTKTKLSAEDIETFFAWCWRRKMVNVALTFQEISITTFKNHSAPNIKITNKVYGYTPFPKLKVLDLSTQVEQGGGAFRTDRIVDVKGYEFRTPMTKNLPYVFLLKDPPNCNTTATDCKATLSGTTGRLYTEYVKKLNGKIKIIEMNTTNIEEDLILPAARNEVQISVHPFSALTLSLNRSQASYPLSAINACIIVPVKTDFDKAKYLNSPFQFLIWILFALMFLVLMVLQLGAQYSNAAMHKYDTASFLGHALITAASVVLTQAYLMRLLKTHSLVYKSVYLLLLAMAFLLTSAYTASLTSLLSSVQLVDQIDTVEQFLAAGLELLLTQYQKDHLFKRARLPRALEQRFKIVNDSKLAFHHHNLDTQYAYIATSDQWMLSSFKQKSLSKPLLRQPSAELCSQTFFLKLPLQWNSPFELSLALFIMLAQETGLARKWQDMSIAESRLLKLLVKVTRNDAQWRPLNGKDYQIFAYMMGALWSLSCLCFLLEILGCKMKWKSFGKLRCWSKIFFSVINKNFKKCIKTIKK